MAEYIEREALEAAFRAVTKKEIEFYGYYNLLCFPDKAACEIARGVPASDVVEVVRCKDCKHWRQSPWGDYGEMVCGVDWLPTEADGFCSSGERRDDDAAG